MIIREGTLADAINVLGQIDEFSREETLVSLKKRIGDKPFLVLIAEQDGESCGVKVGYQLDEDCFYSWLGGVTRKGRRRGIAQALLHSQERWVAQHGYTSLRVKSRNCFAGMLCLLLNNHYLIEHLEKKDSLDQYRLHFVKKITHYE
ncbi:MULTISPECIES: GNAT family N-acetyltransferase [Enterovibrio]|uniref:GNAT family N-acetyltransferase n=1 Tax=Enterovibrio norvegicus FF-454 TaxID=1185651 RepID=A0A1E5CEE4_9GAMM|nr:GNAT family N-acetyltransferase [Enterovibrio norvegicus]OEE63522.1 GNAT family N-acetyltransferase [Enterovibrio norvegicus FF-454]